MIAIAVSLRNAAPAGIAPGRAHHSGRARLVLFAVLAAALVCLARPDLVAVALASLAGAYLQVSVFVAGTLLLVAWSERASGIDVTAWLSPRSPWRLAAAALLGALPGCGPQIVVATFYLSGLLPVSVLAANAISNDGDALFPALALAPRAALAATVVTAIPALVVGYALHLALPVP